MPAAQRLLDEHRLTASQVPATGPGGRLLKEDVLAFVRSRPTARVRRPQPLSHRLHRRRRSRQVDAGVRKMASSSLITDGPAHRARRGQAAEHVAANHRRTTGRSPADRSLADHLQRNRHGTGDVDSQEVQGPFRGTPRLSSSASCRSLPKRPLRPCDDIPAVNAEIRDDNIVYRHYQDIGIAIGGGKGLVVPVLRNVEQMSFAEIELAISDFVKTSR